MLNKYELAPKEVRETSLVAKVLDPIHNYSWMTECVLELNAHDKVEPSEISSIEMLYWKSVLSRGILYTLHVANTREVKQNSRRSQLPDMHQQICLAIGRKNPFVAEWWMSENCCRSLWRNHLQMPLILRIKLEISSDMNYQLQQDLEEKNPLVIVRCPSNRHINRGNMENIWYSQDSWWFIDSWRVHRSITHLWPCSIEASPIIP